MIRVRAIFERLKSETGTSLIEVTVASAILIVVMAGLMGMASVATSITENQGHLGARTTEYSVDKMEQLLELTYGDAQSNTTVFPSVNNGGTGLAVGGNSDPATPAVNYTDYLDQRRAGLRFQSLEYRSHPAHCWIHLGMAVGLVRHSLISPVAEIVSP